MSKETGLLLVRLATKNFGSFIQGSEATITLKFSFCKMFVKVFGLDFKVLVRKGVLEVLDLLSGNDEGVTARELREKTPVSTESLRLLRDNGLVEFTAKQVVVREVPVKLRRASCWLSDKGKRLLELCGEVDADLLRVTPKQLECLKLLEKEKKYLSEILEEFKPTLQNLVKRGLVEKRVAEEETKRKVYGKRLVYTITEKGLKAYEALKVIDAL